MNAKKAYGKAKEWMKKNKKIIIAGVITVVGGAVAITLLNPKDENKDEFDEIVDAFSDKPTEQEESYDCDVDRYVVDKSIMELLPEGVYDVFDMYENQRVDFVKTGAE